MSELLELCGSDDLSLVTLREMINTLGPRASSQNPSCFHQACANENVTLEIVQLLYHTFPGALQLRNDGGSLPIHRLCYNKDLDDINSLDILRFMLSIGPNLQKEANNRGYLPIHYAVMYKSTAFCKELINAYPESLRMVETSEGILPIHYACANGKRDDTADTIQYMLELDRELVNAEDSNGYLPIHCAAMSGMTKSIELLLKFDPDAASKEVNNGSRLLPLHIACSYDDTNLSSIQVLYDAYPEAILIHRAGGIPPDFARSEENEPAIEFLQTQLVYARQAQDMIAMATVDDDGWLPLHRALKDNISLGSIKLIVRGNPAAVRVVADQMGAYPLHIACKFSPAKVVKYLVELYGDTVLNIVDANNNSPLHYVCHGGNLRVMKYLLEVNVPSVSERNNDNKLAIHLLFECGENTLDRDSLEYIETIHQLLLANPEMVRDFMPF